MRIESDGEDAMLWVKIVPGASRDAIVGPLGDRLKIAVSSPPEGGKANRQVCGLVAEALGIKSGDVVVEHGASNPQKVIRIRKVSIDQIRHGLG